jgi:hypothetical protein
MRRAESEAQQDKTRTNRIGMKRTYLIFTSIIPIFIEDLHELLSFPYGNELLQ